MHVDEIKAMARKAHNDKTVRERLFANVFGSVRDVAVNSAWTLTHLPKNDNGFIDEHREALVAIAIATADMSLRRITLTLLERLDWTTPDIDDVPEYYINLLDFCMTHLMMADEPYGVRSLCMKIAYKISRPYPELLAELRQSLLLIEPSDLGAGVLNTRNKLLASVRLS